MTEESLRGEEKEILRRRLELLQKEYERTAQRLQRAERKAAVRRHVQNRISDENRQLQINTSGVYQLIPDSSSISNSNLLSNQPLQLEAKPDDGLLSSKKHLLVRFHLPEGSDDSPCSTPTCKRSPTHRLRSKRSRLRLQSREKESDIDSQNKAKKGTEKRVGEENEKKNIDFVSATNNNGVEMESKGKQLNDTTRQQTEIEKIQNREKVPGIDRKIGEGQQRVVLKDRLGEIHVNSTNVGLNMCSTVENYSANQSPVKVFPVNHIEVKNSLADQFSDINSQSSSSASDQLFMQVQSCQSADLSIQSNNQRADVMENAFNGAGIDSVDEMTASFSSEKTGFLDSCTLVEGLPFPLEYYVRTTRRMAAAHSPVDLNAVILGHLSRGRGRRRSSFSQARGRSLLTSDDSQTALDQPRCRGRGRRGRRGRRHTRGLGITKSSQARSCTEDLFEVKSESLTETELSNQSTQSQSLQQNSLPGESNPQPDATSQPESSLKPKPVLNTHPIAADYKDLSDSQLYLDCKFLPDSEVYPIFRRRREQADKGVSCSPAQTNTNGKNCRPLLSLVKLSQALKMMNCRPSGSLLTTSDIQDFHLPDDEFGQLKLQKLRMSCLNVEPLSPYCSPHNTRRNSTRYSFRALKNNNSNGVKHTDNELFLPELLPPSSYLEGSFFVSSAKQSLIPRNNVQSVKHTETANVLKSDIGSQKPCQSSITSSAEVDDQETKNRIHLRNTNDKETPVAYNQELVENFGKHTHDLKAFRGHKQGSGSPGSVKLNLSMSLTQHSEHGPDSSLPSIGITPHFLSATSPSDFSPFQPSPSGHSAFLCSSQCTENAAPAVATLNQTPKASQGVCKDTLQTRSQIAKRDLQTPPEPGETTELANKDWLSPVTTTPLQNVANVVSSISESCPQAMDTFKEKNQYQNIQTGHQSQIQPKSDRDSVIKPCVSDPSANHSADGDSFLALDMADTGVLTEYTLDLENSVHLTMDTKTTCESQAAEIVHYPDETITSATLQKIHTFKTLQGGSVLDVCLVQWPSDDWCVCVAGEWSVCVWGLRAGVQQWSLIHTWTFTESVISLQGVPDCPGLLCVSLGRLEITEARILSCSLISGVFSQAGVCKGVLQAVVGVSDCRLVCCSASGAQQKVQVFRLCQDCRVSDVLSLVSTTRSIQTLAAVEQEKDALIGWTKCNTLLIWNMKSGHLLQTVHLTETMSMATCLKGYTSKGALCVLFQSASSCDEEADAALFTLIALNPLTGRHFTLTSFTRPTASGSDRLIDGDVCESMLAGVFQSGHLTIWNLKGDVTIVHGGGQAQLCRLVRWAGPSTLLTGNLNGDVNLYQFKP